ncbi:MAG: DUF418 domain-containing protein [Lysobacteraceae bacterium]
MTDATDTTPAPATPASSLGPLTSSERIDVLDVLRGFALLGILLMNIEYFTRPMQGIAMGLDPTLSGWDYVAGWSIMAFVQGKFWTLFSMLFGMGFAVMLERIEARGGRFFGIYARRLAVLLLIGLVHAFLIWSGDILVSYALTGFLLLLFFRRTPVRRLWKWGVAFYLIPLLLMWTFAGAISMARVASPPEEVAKMDEEFATAASEHAARYEKAEQVYSGGSYSDAVVQRVIDTGEQLGFIWMFILMLLGVFLLGAWLLRSGRLSDPQAHRSFFLKCVVVAGPVGLVLVLLAMRGMQGINFMVPTTGVAATMSLMQIGSLLLCLAYLGAVTLLTIGPMPWLRDWLGPTGRMALTNYLGQSLFFTLFFYSYGLGLWGQVSRVWQVPLVFGFWFLQILVSRWWLSRFRFGPAEWLWRSLTYGKAQPMRR